ncbi:MAG: hypothetical protein AAGB29_03265 [Planctomycetota bacterium]
MPATLKVRDESMAPGGEDHVFELEFPTESITVRELIRERVYQEVDDFNRQVRAAKPQSRWRGLVRPTELEEQLNGPNKTVRAKKEVDWQTQYDLACDAFEKNRFFVLVGDRQAGSLDERIEIGRETEVSFLQRVLLVGG